MILQIVVGAAGVFFICGGVGALIRPPPRYRRRDGVAAMGVGACLLAIAWAVGPHASAAKPPPPEVAAAVSSATADQAPAATETADDHRRWAEHVAAYTKRASASAPTLGSCEDGAKGEICRGAQDEFVTHDWSAAHRGDLGAARNVAFCLSTSCQGAVVPNRIQGCAWALAVIGSGAATVSQVDSDNAKLDCGQLDPTERYAANSRAADLTVRLPPFHEID